MKRRFLIGISIFGMLALVIGIYWINRDRNKFESNIELKTETDSLLAVATGILNDDDVKVDSSELKIPKEEINKKLNNTEKEKNTQLQEKAKLDIYDGPFSKMSCDEIYKMYCENMMEYAKTGVKGILSKMPLGEDAKFTGCLSLPEIKPKVDSVDRLVRKLLRNKTN